MLKTIFSTLFISPFIFAADPVIKADVAEKLAAPVKVIEAAIENTTQPTPPQPPTQKTVRIQFQATGVGRKFARAIRSTEPPHEPFSSIFPKGVFELEVPESLVKNYSDISKLKGKAQRDLLIQLLKTLPRKKIKNGGKVMPHHLIRLVTPGDRFCPNRKCNYYAETSNQYGYIAIEDIVKKEKNTIFSVQGVENSFSGLAEDDLKHRTPGDEVIPEDEETSPDEESEAEYCIECHGKRKTYVEDINKISEQMIKNFENSVEVNDSIRHGLKAYAGKSTRWCYRYVKQLVRAGGMVDSYMPRTEAKHAGKDLEGEGFVNLLKVKGLGDKYKNTANAPRGSVLVYARKGKPGHIEMKTRDGFLSDFYSPHAITDSRNGGKYQLIGVYIKPGLGQDSSD